MPNSTVGDRTPFILSATVDFPDDVGAGPFSHELLEKMMGHLTSMGVRRIYWLYYGDPDKDSYWGGGLFHHSENGLKTHENIGEPLKAAVPIAHKHGIEVYGVLKPYNTGSSGTYPEGSPEPKPNDIRLIGGTLLQAVNMTEQYPHVRLRRRSDTIPPDLEGTAVKKVRLLKKDDSPTRIGKENLEIWTSPNNYRYQQRDVDFTLKDAVEPAPGEVRDYYGELVTAKGAPVRTLTLEGLDLADKFILVTTNFHDDAGDFTNTPLGMIEAYGEGPEPLPVVVAARSVTWIAPRDFRTYGLEFDSCFGTLEVTLDEDNAVQWDSSDWRSHQNGAVIAFSLGKNEYVPAMPCEMYPEVRRLWSGWIDRMLDAGVDGIDLRISSHGNLVDEPFDYGFNEPVLQEYRRRHGQDFGGDDSELPGIAEIRGDHYTDFVRETSRKVRAAGKKMQFHMHTEAFRPNPVHGQIMGIPPHLDFQWRTWLKEGLMDGITLRTSWFEAWEDPPQSEAARSRLSTALSDPVVEEALSLVQELGVPAYLNRYLGRAVSFDEYLADMEHAINDPRLSGFDLYEYSGLAQATSDGTDLVPVEDKIELIGAKSRELGLV